MSKVIINRAMWLRHVDTAIRRDFFDRLLPKLPIYVGKLDDGEGARTEFFGNGKPYEILISEDMFADNDVLANLGPGPDGIGAAASLAHELAHVAQRMPRNAGLLQLLGTWDAHDAADFQAAVHKMGLIGPPCCTRAGKSFIKWVEKTVRPVYEKELADGRLADTAVPERRAASKRPESKEVGSRRRSAA